MSSLRPPGPSGRRLLSPDRSGFTLLEVVIALAILGLALYVLVATQASAVVQTLDSRRMLTGSYLAQQVMTEALLRLEREGFGTSDVEEEGDFADFAELLDADVDFGDRLDGYQWAYAIRKVDIQLGDVAGAEDQMSAAGIGPSTDQAENAQDAGGDGGKDLSALGVQPDAISEMLGPYIREVRVVVWWGEEPDPDQACEDCIEIVTHVANPSGTEVLSGEVPT